ncbi:MAG: hypothetical protein AABX29_00220 [Nanoarchaeota archaeon]
MLQKPIPSRTANKPIDTSQYVGNFPIPKRYIKQESSRRESLAYIVNDAELGRREIIPGTRQVSVCVGHFIEQNPITRKRSYVPIYRIEDF